MLKKKWVHLFAVAAFLTGSSLSAENMGVVDAVRCLKDTKLGKEQEGKVKGLQEKMVKVLKEKEQSLNELAQKFNEEYLESISEEEQGVMKEKFQTMGRELQSYEGNYYQTMQRAQKKMQQTMIEAIKEATAEIAKEKKLPYVINDDFLLYYEDSFDITEEVISLMNENYKEESDESDPEA